MHIIVERMIPFPEDDARIQGLKVRAETYACEKNIVKSEIIFIHMHMSWVYVYIYILYRVLFIFIVQTFSGYNILSRNSNGTMLIFDRLFFFYFFCSFLLFRYRHFVYMTINLTFANYVFYRAVTRSLRTLIIACFRHKIKNKKNQREKQKTRYKSDIDFIHTLVLEIKNQLRIDKIRVYLSVFRMKTICYKSFFANVINSIAVTIQIWEIRQDFCFLFQFSSSLPPPLLFLFFLILFLPQILD